MHFLKVEHGDIKLILTYLYEAAVWLNERKIDYWQNWIDPPERYINWIKEGLHAQQFHRVILDEQEIGIFRLQQQDQLFWGEKNDSAVYIHSFTVNRKYFGQGLGYKILKEIVINQKDSGFVFLRLDCGSSIKKLIQYYENFGFRKVGSTILNNEELVLLEMKL